MSNTISSKIAIANVPVQNADMSSLYNSSEALCTGTVFPELNKPFFATQSGPKSEKCVPKDECEKLLLNIMEQGFFVEDLTLYLDTHPDDQKAYHLFLQISECLKQLKAEFAEKYYPLTTECIAGMANKRDKFAWTIGPAPWEGACE